MTLEKGQCCRMRCPVQIPRCMFNIAGTFFQETHTSLIRFSSKTKVFSLSLSLSIFFLSHFIGSCHPENVAFHKENFLSRSSPQPYFHICLTLYPSLLHYLSEFNCEHFKTGCVSPHAAAAHQYLHSCTINNSSPMTEPLGM